MNEPYEVVADAHADRSEWLARRREGIGGSDIPAIVGLSQWRTPLSVYVDKLGLGDEQEEREQMKWGLLLEPLILAEFGKDTHRMVTHAGKLLRSKALPIALCTLDGTQFRTRNHPLQPVEPAIFPVLEEGNVQIKNYGGYVKWTDAVPPDVYAQVQWEMGVTERSFSSAVALLNGNKLVWADVPFNDEYFSSILVPAAQEFWDRVQKGEPPDIDGSEVSAKALLKLYPKDDGTTVELGEEFMALDEELGALQKIEKQATSDIWLLKNKLRAAIGLHTHGALPNGVTYTYRHQEKDGYMVSPSAFRVLTRKIQKRG